MVQQEVIIYTKRGDISSELLKKRFNREGVKYKEFDVSTDAEARKEMLELSGGQDIVPVVVMGERVLVGLESGR
ncbi:TPA: glutaredoxin family protein [Candidatus Poribacteria bacterium]|nr:glutaredoxin family protein [Candidatus Poribacteria bacterium]